MGMETIEFAEFRIAQGVDEKEFLKISDGIMPDLRRQRGFLSRQLVKNDDGTWADIVRWKTLADALDLAESFAKIESCHNYLGMIDPSSVKIRHFEQIRSY
jgi:heme-degrading monooxygenase HmoA